jgi:hypothetical protein
VEVSGKLYALATLSPGKQPLYPLDRMMGGPQGRHNSRGNLVSYIGSSNRSDNNNHTIGTQITTTTNSGDV